MINKAVRVKEQKGIEIKLVIDFWKISTVVLLLLSLFLVFYYGVFNSSHKDFQSFHDEYPPQEEVVSKIKAFMEDYLLNGRGIVEVGNVTDVSGLYRIELEVGNQTAYVFATPDARYMFLPLISQGSVYFQVIDIEKFKEIIERLRIARLTNSTTPLS